MIDSRARSRGLLATKLIDALMERSNLTAVRERALLNQYQTSDSPDERQAALATLWESHAKLVIAIARQYRRTGLEFSDLVGAGHLGLHTAIARFNTGTEDVRLAGFAASWIRWSIRKYVQRNQSLLRLPESKAHRQLACMAERLIRDARRSCMVERVPPTDHEIHTRIGSRIGMDPAEVTRSLAILRNGVVSLDEPADGRAAPMTETLADHAARTEDDLIHRMDGAKLRSRVRQLADRILGAREREVFLARCMAGDEERITLDQLAIRFGVTRERVYQLETSAKRKIATALTAEGLGVGMGANGGTPDLSGPVRPGRTPRVTAGRAPLPLRRPEVRWPATANA